MNMQEIMAEIDARCRARAKPRKRWRIAAMFGATPEPPKVMLSEVRQERRANIVLPPTELERRLLLYAMRAEARLPLFQEYER
jgi:hypothetical protein